MGIYVSGNIFGILIYDFNDDDLSNIIYEKKYDSLMTNIEKKEAYLFYNGLNNKNELFLKIYTERSCTYNNNNNNDKYFMWYPISLDIFLEKFNI
jgi:hypothetical protein